MKADDLRAVQFGSMHALQVAIRAIVASLPNSNEVIAAFAREHQESMALMLAKPLPELAIEAYKEALRGCAPNPDLWLEK